MVDRYASKDYVMRERKRKRERKRESEWYVAAAAATAPMVGSTLEKY